MEGSIARALIKDSKILILDDSLSAVDPSTEQRIIAHLDKNLSNHTVIIITHRINTLSNIDKIIVLDEGNVIEVGTPDELFQKEGYYHKMMNNI